MNKNNTEEWKDIKSAPKDGREIICYSPHFDSSIIVKYTLENKFGEASWVESWDDDLIYDDMITHWKPLPKRPGK